MKLKENPSTPQNNNKKTTIKTNSRQSIYFPCTRDMLGAVLPQISRESNISLSFMDAKWEGVCCYHTQAVKKLLLFFGMEYA